MRVLVLAAGVGGVLWLGGRVAPRLLRAWRVRRYRRRIAALLAQEEKTWTRR